MKKVDTHFFNPKQKEIKWYNRNFYYLATILFIGAMCLTYFMFQNQIGELVEKSKYFNLFFMAFRHGSLGHLIANCFSFFVVSLFLERHFGSIKYLLLTIVAIPLSSIAVFLFSNSFMWRGESGVNFFMYALFVTVVIFNFKPYLAQKWQPIFTIIIIALICVLLCWNGDSSALTTNPAAFFKFGRFSSLVGNTAHWASAIMGAGVGLFANIFALGNRNRQDD